PVAAMYNYLAVQSPRRGLSHSSKFPSSSDSNSRSSSVEIRSFNHSKTASVPFATVCHLGTRNVLPAISNRLKADPPPQFLLDPSALSKPTFGGRALMLLLPTSRTCRPWTASNSRLLNWLSAAMKVFRLGYVWRAA